jgi:ubiquitin carboxyl-terminal hydrolase 8
MNEHNNDEEKDIFDGRYTEYKGKGLTGLVNVGNSCYLNSTMQVISHTYELNNFLNLKTKDDNKFYELKLNKAAESVLLVEWDKLRQLMWSENCTIGPWGFVNAVRKIAHIKQKDIFTGYAQNDLPEFLIFIIDSLHMALIREVDMTIKGKIKNSTDKLASECYQMMRNMYKKEYSEMLDIFYGISVSQIKSIHKNKILSLRPEPFSILSLSLPEKESNITLFDCIDLYCKPERLEEENAWYNEKTKKKEDVNKGIIFWSLPNILIIDLKRFNNRNQKIHTNISIPLNSVDFSKWIYGYKKHSYVYDLYGACYHSGGVLGGHYTSSVKNANGQWYLFNDTDVKKLNENDVITNNIYCLFYRKKK